MCKYLIFINIEKFEIFRVVDSTKKFNILINLNIINKSHSPTVVSSYAPHSNCMNRLCIKYREILRIDQFERAFVQVHK